jgi:hypothetical protein
MAEPQRSDVEQSRRKSAEGAERLVAATMETPCFTGFFVDPR